MDLSIVRDFVILTECMNYSEAAERLSLTQPTLTKHIQTLEREIGGSLFHRTTRSMELSERGSAFLPHARKLTEDYEEALSALQMYEHKRQHSFSVGVHRNLQHFHIDQSLIEFHKVYPEDTVTIREGNEQELKELFKKKEINIYTGSEAEAHSHHWNFLPVHTTTVVALVRESSPEARRNEIPLSSLREENFLLPPRHSTPHSIILDALKAEAITPHIIYEGDSHGCADFVKAGMGVLLQLENIAGSYVEPGLVIRPVTPSIPFRYGIIYRDRQKLSLPERHLVTFCENIAETEA